MLAATALPGCSGAGWSSQHALARSCDGVLAVTPCQAVPVQAGAHSVFCLGVCFGLWLLLGCTGLWALPMAVVCCFVLGVCMGQRAAVDGPAVCMCVL